jgi:Flp pilus assembly protein TadG
MTRLLRDESGSIIVEAAFCIPLLLLLVLGGVQMSAWQSMQSATQTTAGAAAYQAARALATGGDVNAAATAAFESNTGLYIFGAVPSFGGCTTSGTTATCIVSATMAPLFPFVGVGQLTVTSTVTD